MEKNRRGWERRFRKGMRFSFNHSSGLVDRAGIPAYFAGICGLLIFSSGCATDPALKERRLVVTTPTAQFYKDTAGPDMDFFTPAYSMTSQAELKIGPGVRLPKGAVVTLLKREATFSHVMTGQGVAGYVANDQLRPATALDSGVVVDIPSAPVQNSRTVGGRPKSNPAPVHKSKDEQLDLEDVPLPG